MNKFAKITLLASMVVWTAACSKSGSGGGGAKALTPSEMKAQHKPNDCPDLSGRYESVEEQGRLTIAYKATPEGARYSMNDDEMIADGNPHSPVNSQDSEGIGYTAFCSKGVLTTQIVFDGKFLGTSTFSKINANGDILNINSAGADSPKVMWIKK